MLNGLVVVPNFFCLHKQEHSELIDSAVKCWNDGVLKVQGNGSMPFNVYDTGIVEQIYKKFIDYICKTFNVTVNHKKSKSIFWLYLSTITDNAPIWHDHLLTSSLHCVFYVNVPNASGGELEYLSSSQIFKYKPNNGDLIIMPNYLLHRPLPSNSEEPRISINIEVVLMETGTHV